MHWSQILQTYRREKALTQEALAEILGCTAQTVSRWERGRDRPSLVHEMRLRAILKVQSSGFDLRAGIETSSALMLLISDKHKVAATSRGHALIYRYCDNPFLNRPVEQSIPEATMHAFEKVGGVRYFLANASGCEMILRRKPDDVNRTAADVWSRYVTSVITLPDGQRFWLSQGVPIASSVGLVESLTPF